MALELSRVDQGDGTTVVTVAVGATGQALMTVMTSVLDQPGYSDMLNAFVAKQERIHTIVHGGDQS